MNRSRWLSDMLDNRQSNAVFWPIEHKSQLSLEHLEKQPFWRNPTHFHDCDQLSVVVRGGARVFIGNRFISLYPGFGVVIPNGVIHHVETTDDTTLLTAYFDHAPFSLPRSLPIGIAVSKLLELCLKAFSSTKTSEVSRLDALATVISSEVLISLKRPMANSVGLPSDPRVATIVQAVIQDPANDLSREDWAKEVGASARTIDRIFCAECGVSFQSWKRQIVVQAAIKGLAKGQPVQCVAYDLGYDSDSAFIRMFKGITGRTPGDFQTLARQRIRDLSPQHS